MASLRTVENFILKKIPFFSKPTIRKGQNVGVSSLAISTRSAVLISVLPLSLVALPQTLLAREKRNRKAIPIEDYLTNTDGVKYYDLIDGKGPIAKKGMIVQVHFDCIYRGITVVSSRESKLLAGNRTIDQAAPKPPKPLYDVTEGMRVGGKRTVIVPPEAGYGARGMNEIPPGPSLS